MTHGLAESTSDRPRTRMLVQALGRHSRGPLRNQLLAKTRPLGLAPWELSGVVRQTPSHEDREVSRAV